MPTEMLAVCSQSSSNQIILSPHFPLSPSPSPPPQVGDLMRSFTLLAYKEKELAQVRSPPLLPHLSPPLPTPSPPFPFSPLFLPPLLSSPHFTSTNVPVCLSVCPSIHPACQIAVDTTMTPSYMTAVEMLDDETFLGADSQHLFVCQKNKWVEGASGRDV